jgi:hypothetical protein
MVPPRVSRPVPEPGGDHPGHPRGPLHGDDESHDPPPPLGPEGEGPRRDDGGGADDRGGVGGRGEVAAKAVEEDEEVVEPGWRPCVSSSMTRSSRTSRKVGKGLWRVIHVLRWA